MGRSEFDYGLWRGPAPSSEDDVAGFDLVVCLRSWDFIAIERERFWCQKMEACFRHIPMSPFLPPTADQLDAAVELLISARKGRLKVLVHCQAGVDRTGFVVAAYKSIRKKETWASVYWEMIHHGFHLGRFFWWLPFLRRYLASRRQGE